MSEATDLLACLGHLGGIDLVVHRSAPTLAVAAVNLPDGRRLIAIERTYRPGVCVILEATEDEMAAAREGDLWELWNSDRTEDVFNLLRTVAKSGAQRGTRCHF